MTDFATCDENVADSIRLNLTANGGWEREGLVAGASGLDDVFFNAAAITKPQADARGAIAGIRAFFGDVPFTIWLRDGLDPAMADAAFLAGLSVTDGPPLLVLDSLDRIPPKPAGVEIGPYVEADRRAAVTASALGNGMAPHLAESFVPTGIAEHPTAGIVLGRIDGEIVTTAQWVLTGEAVGIYAVSTVPGHRGKGLGAATTWAAVAEGRKVGARWSLLQASEMGLGVYERMGFEVVGRYRFLRTKPGGRATRNVGSVGG